MDQEYFESFRRWFSQKFHFVSIEVINWIYCQSMLETGNFKSRIYCENHNLFGMKLAKKRITNARGVSRGHAVYLCNIDSIFDYMLWLSFNGFVQSDFKDLDLFRSEFLKTAYNPKMDSYISSINKLYSKFFAK